MITVIDSNKNVYKIKSFLDAICSYFILNTPNITLIESYKQTDNSHKLSDDDELLTIYVISYDGNIQDAIFEFTQNIKSMIAVTNYEDITS